MVLYVRRECCCHRAMALRTSYGFRPLAKRRALSEIFGVGQKRRKDAVRFPESWVVICPRSQTADQPWDCRCNKSGHVKAANTLMWQRGLLISCSLNGLEVVM